MVRRKSPSTTPSPFDAYIAALERDLRAGVATEHTHRPALKTLIECLGDSVVATNEPQRVECGAPDYIVTHRSTPLGYIEAKDIGEDLAACAESDQLLRYRRGLANLVLTDYVAFQWYVNGELKASHRLASVDSKGRVSIKPSDITAVAGLLKRFLATPVPLITSANALAKRLAAAAQIIRGTLEAALATEDGTGPLNEQMKGFKKVLVHSLKAESFCDMYAQTICYGLFAARCECDDGATFSRERAAILLPRTNPFLRKLFGHIAGQDLDDRIAWAVDDLAHTLERTDVRALLEQFGALTGKNDPVLHFYETFLTEYDRGMREDRGVYYTPQPAVSFIVKSVDILTREAFGLDGLHDNAQDRKHRHRLCMLDPAAGTGTFLHEIIALISQRYEGNKGLWSAYVSQHLLPRLCGFEFLMAPYTIAHLKLGLQLEATGYDFKRDQRLKVYLTNTLDEAHETAEPLFTRWLTSEANEASAVKRDYPVMVIVGNPPYSIKSQNEGEWIKSLLSDYKKGLNERKLNLDDDFIKFFRFAQWRIERTGYGILGFITNNTYLDGITHRQMRKSLLEAFDDIWILNLHGDATKGSKASDGKADQNIFDIKQGVAIGLFVRKRRRVRTKGSVHYAELLGSRADKLKTLAASDVSTITWKRIKPDSKYAFFVPKTFRHKDSYEAFPCVTDIFPIGSSAIQTKRDSLFVDFSDEVLLARMREVINEGPTRAMAAKYPIADSAGWKSESLLTASFRKDLVRSYLFRPFDYRHIYYDERLLGRARFAVFKHMLMPNIALATLRQTVDDGFRHVFCTDRVSDINLLIGHHVSDQVFPLYIYQGDILEATRKGTKLPFVVNLAKPFIERIARNTGLAFKESRLGDLRSTFGVEDVFHYVYGILHHNDYRTRYWEMLKIEFPRIPVVADRALMKTICDAGQSLVRTHTKPQRLPTVITFPHKGTNCVECVNFRVIGNGVGEVWINDRQCFQGIGVADWECRIGAHKVCQKWLKDRHRRTLSFDDLKAYMAAVAGVAHTRAIADTMTRQTGSVNCWPVA